MMAVVIAEPLLPVLPAQAVQVGPVAGLVEGESGGQVYVRGDLVYAWDAEDEALRRLAAVQLIEAGIAKTRPVAAAFGVRDQSVWRWRAAFAEAGLAGLVGEKKGPKRATKLTDELIDQIVAAKQAGGSNRQVAAEVGVSEGSVRRAVRLHSEDTGQQREQQQAEADQPSTAHGGAPAAENIDAAAGDQADLVVLAEPEPRAVERGLARWGLIAQAAPVFAPAARVPVAGLLVALPGLEATGLLGCASGSYDRLPAGFYGLETVLLEAVFRTLAGAPRAEGAGRFSPTDLGRVLGMDRAPEVKTIRRKLGQLARQGKAAELLGSMATHHLNEQDSAQEQAGLVLYVDGHVRAYQGTKKIGKTHSPRLRFPAPATVETWVSDADGDPVMVVMAEPGASLAAELRRLLPELRTAVGDDRRVLVGFDRGGWSPALFAHMQAAGFDVLTWRKGPTDDVADSEFASTVFTDDTGIEHHWNLADTTVELPIKDAEPVRMRQITRLDTKKTTKPRQAHILTSRADLTAAELAYRMGSRWRQENYFRYGRMHLDLDSHDTYSSTADDPARMVPNPAKREAHQAVKTAAGRVEREQATSNANLLAARTPAPGESEVLITSQMHNDITEKWRAATEELNTATIEHALTPTRVALGELSPDQQVLNIETKLLTHAIKIAAFNTTTAIARAIRLHTSYARANDEAFTLARKVLTHTGDIDPRADGELIIRLDPMPTARETAAVAELCEHLTAAEITFPGTDRLLHYQIKNSR